MSIQNTIKHDAAMAAWDYIGKNPEENIPKVLDQVEKLDVNGTLSQHIAGIRRTFADPDNGMRKLALSLWEDIDPEQRRVLFEGLAVNSMLMSAPVRAKAREKYQCNIPWAILMDLTSACNLQCTGCWAAEYGNRLNLTVDEIDDIIRQGKELGVYMYIYTGGEPLVRRKDLMQICEKHNDCVFLSFTNGTLIDDAFAEEMLRVRNFIPAISLEGFEEATDSRRGTGVYQKAVNAMEILHKYRLPYGISACYTSVNYDSITSEEFYDKLIEMGAYFIWYFHYMPIGNDAVPALLPTPEQRELVCRRIRYLRANKPLFAMDFQNDAEYVGGCIAGGRRYLHINANGDVDPCVFIHYSDSNIRKKTLLECLQSPVFMAYHDNMPFNDNMFRPCPMLENPHYIRRIVNETSAPSTDLQSPESVEHLTSKTESYAEKWAPKADEMWQERLREKESRKA